MPEGYFGFGTATVTVRITHKVLSRKLGTAAVLCAVCSASLPACGAKVHTNPPILRNNPGAGDAPATALPLATDISPDLNTKAIDTVVRKVGDWQLTRSQKYFDQGWLFATLYAGYMAAAGELPDKKYREAMLRMGNRFDWQLGTVPPGAANVADYYAIGQTYLDLYRIYHQKKMIEPTKATFDRMMTVPDDPSKPVWWWCDALFMGPPTLARLYRATGNKAYLDFMDKEWWITSNLLYQPKYGLFTRDATYLGKTDENGKPIFWARGNGWVMAGIARTLEIMPADYPSRPKYIEQFKQMASSVVPLQADDGLWRTDLLNAKAYPAPEVSGSVFFVYALAWGIDQGFLDRATYLPVVEKGWRGILSHVYEDGRLGAIQSVNQEPGVVPPTSSYVYGVGGFLLAGSELHRLAAHSK